MFEPRLAPYPRLTGSYARYMLLFICFCCLLSGCSDQEYLVQRSDLFAPIKRPFNPETWIGPSPSKRSLDTLQRYDLVVWDDSDWIRKYSLDETLGRLQASIQHGTTQEKLYALAELAFLDAKTLQDDDQPHRALERYTLALVNAYEFLFTPQFQHSRNPYDPQFQEICRIYNQSLEQAMRIMAGDKQLRDGTTYSISVGDQQVDVKLRFPPQTQLAELKFVSDFRIQKLLRHHRTFGLGVAMIGIRGGQQTNPAIEQYYPPGMTLPLTAFLYVADQVPQTGDKVIKHCTLDFHKTVDNSALTIHQASVPLQTDTSIPLAYLLDQPSLSRPREAATNSLLNPNEAGAGLFMLEPYDPQKIPVVMIHGFWSSPMIWMNMVNDLRSFPSIRENYQFWFYQYPTSQPFWFSAAKLRSSLQNIYHNLDLKKQHRQLHNTVLIGHSMGGLLSLMQTVESHDAFWQLVSHKPFGQLQAPQHIRQSLANTVFFHPNPSISKVITIATPHQGSVMANNYTQWIGQTLFQLPEPTNLIAKQLIRENPNLFHSTELLTTKTSLDSLEPGGKIFHVLKMARRNPATSYHNIYGDTKSSTLIQKLASSSDGVVTTESAQLPGAQSELSVDANHLTITDATPTILEIRRILLSEPSIKSRIRQSNYQTQVHP